MNTNGIGLGLVICENIVEMFGGKIDFVSEPGVGSVFKFTFKLEEEELSNTLEEEERDGQASTHYQINGNKLNYEWKPLQANTQAQIKEIKYINQICY
jgi:hypothetical protein